MRIVVEIDEECKDCQIEKVREILAENVKKYKAAGITVVSEVQLFPHKQSDDLIYPTASI
jgi:hypothetical protein